MDDPNTQQPQQTTPPPATPPATPPPAPATPPAATTPPPAPATPPTPTPAATTSETAAPLVSEAAEKPCSCPTFTATEWDKKQVTIDKTFLKTYSPRIFYMPFQMPIDIMRLKKKAVQKDYKVPDAAYILDTGAKFLANIMIEVEGADPNDKDVVSLAGKTFYAKTSNRDWKEMKKDIEELKAELGKEPTEFYILYGACPKCKDTKEVKTVYLAI